MGSADRHHTADLGSPLVVRRRAGRNRPPGSGGIPDGHRARFPHGILTELRHPGKTACVAGAGLAGTGAPARHASQRTGNGFGKPSPSRRWRICRLAALLCRILPDPLPSRISHPGYWASPQWNPLAARRAPVPGTGLAA